MTFPWHLECLAANMAASWIVVLGGSTFRSANRIITCDPGHPAACIHQSSLSRYCGLVDNSSLSSAFLPTRISILSIDVYFRYGFRVVFICLGPLGLVSPRGGRLGGRSVMFKASAISASCAGNTISSGPLSFICADSNISNFCISLNCSLAWINSASRISISKCCLLFTGGLFVCAL